MSERIDAIRDILNKALSPDRLEISDESHLHAGHAGAKSGKGHFAVLIVSDQFAGKSLIQRHRMVYDALSDLLETDIHALSLQAKTPDEMN